MPDSALLEVDDLSVRFRTSQGVLTAVDGVNFKVDKGETLGIVGESGSGKTVLATALIGLLPNSATVTARGIRFGGEELMALSNKQWRRIRGHRIGMVFQDPSTALNPLRSIGVQLDEAISVHQGNLTKREIRNRSIELLESVGVLNASTKVHEYPHQWSGGMKQRAMIAMALSNSPELLIADEPTTALDVTIQAQVLELLRTIQKERSIAMIFISHSLGVVGSISSHVGVMYSGKLVECGLSSDILKRPLHPYSKALVDCYPEVVNVGKKLKAIEGLPPRVFGETHGCRFRERCTLGREKSQCSEIDPELKVQTDGRSVACHITGVT
jgi:oligopeptide/dipeptide ABC transporter ATP-binding protein